MINNHYQVPQVKWHATIVFSKYLTITKSVKEVQAYFQPLYYYLYTLYK